MMPFLEFIALKQSVRRIEYRGRVMTLPDWLSWLFHCFCVLPMLGPRSAVCPLPLCCQLFSLVFVNGLSERLCQWWCAWLGEVQQTSERIHEGTGVCRTIENESWLIENCRDNYVSVCTSVTCQITTQSQIVTDCSFHSGSSNILSINHRFPRAKTLLRIVAHKFPLPEPHAEFGAQTQLHDSG